MKRTGKCPKCESADIIADATVVDRDGNKFAGELSVATLRNPNALFFKGQQESSVSAWVCGSCGYTEFYTDNPSGLITNQNIKEAKVKLDDWTSNSEHTVLVDPDSLDRLL
jgi:predicted nucleic-acid-binding Zn-ribbon protein